MKERIVSAILAATVATAFIPSVLDLDEVRASSDKKDKSNTCLCVTDISRPKKPSDRNDPWTGNYVYFGSCDGKPIRFRVLDKDSTVHTSGKALFLDSDEILFDEYFDNADTPSNIMDGKNVWKGSGIQAILNGPFLEGFDAMEEAAVMTSKGNGGRSFEPGSHGSNCFGVPVTLNDKVFPLDVADVINEEYGYSSDDGYHVQKDEYLTDRFAIHDVLNRSKDGNTHNHTYMLRTAAAENYLNHYGGVDKDGHIYNQAYNDTGIAPALNLDEASILFSTKTGNSDDEYKLTLYDNDLTIAVPSGKDISISGSAVTIPYEIGGADAKDAARVSVLILDKEYTAATDTGASILYYDSIGKASASSGKFTLPKDLDLSAWGKDYYVYVLAEILNGSHETDYASAPVQIDSDGGSKDIKIERSVEDEVLTPADEPLDLSASFDKTSDNTSLGTTAISNPQKPAGKDSAWSGDYVYFGTYEDIPVKFRVLAKDSTAYTSGKSLFLDSDKSLLVNYYDNVDPYAWIVKPYSNVWDKSGSQILLNDEFLDGFKLAEQDAIAVSTGNGGGSFIPGSKEASIYGSPVSVNDKVFLLDIADITNEEYGYTTDCGFTDDASDTDWTMGSQGYHKVLNHKKAGASDYWLLRTADVNYENNYIAAVHEGGILSVSVYSARIGVAPAMNIDQGSILFASSIGKDTNSFKLTVKDSGLSIKIPEGKEISFEDSKITVPYEISGGSKNDSTRASFLILDKEYLAGNTNAASILSYGKLADDGIITVPEGFDISGLGKEYFVYILAENLNGAYETDFASAPVEVKMAPEVPEEDVAAPDDSKGNPLVYAGIAVLIAAAAGIGVVLVAKNKKKA